MVKRADNFNFWSHYLPKWNFGDALAVFLFENLFFDFIPYKRSPWVVGSVLFDGALGMDTSNSCPELPSYKSDQDCDAVFWGCGLREPGSLSEENLGRVAVFGLRGPLSASDLFLGGEVPLGDPGLLLPALYTPRSHPAFSNKSVCIPHFSDRRSDEELIAASGCDIVLRPAIEKSAEGIRGFIDGVCSASFVLCGALHGAITAAGYGVPFAYWDSGDVDIPFKWKDFSKLVDIPCEFHKNISEAKNFYNEKIKNSLNIPSMWPLLCTAPMFIRPDGLVKVLYYELNRLGGDLNSGLVDCMLQLETKTAHFAHLGQLAQRLTDDIIPALASERDGARNDGDQKSSEILQISSSLAIMKSANTEQKLEIDTLVERLDIEKSRASEAISEAERLMQEQLDLNEKVTALENQLNTQISRLSDVRSGHALEIEALVEQLDIETSRASAAQSEAEKLMEEQLGLDQKMITLEKQLNTQMTSLSDIRVEHKREIEALVEQVGIETSKALVVQTEIERLVQEQRDVAKKMIALENQLTTQISSLSDISALVAQKNEQINALNYEKSQMRQDFINLEYHAAALDLEKSQIHHNFVNLEYHAASLDIGKQAAEKQVELLAQNIDLMHSDMFAMQSNSMAMVMRFDELITKLRTSKVGAMLLKLPILKKYDTKMKKNVVIIQEFLDQFTEAQLGFSAVGRADRITAYLLGATSNIADFPIFDRNLYYEINPDVIGAKIDPFIHYLEVGQNEGRTPHPLINYDYYAGRYPEVARYSYTILEHYIRFGAAKGYNTCELFDTSEYFSQYADVKMSGLNPLLHYLRHPDCRPHKDFDSRFYRINNLDVVKHGFNPLVHYLLYGQAEGRFPSPNTAVAPPVFLVEECTNFVIESIPLVDSNFDEALISAPVSAHHVSVRPVILMIDAFYPRPDQDSGSLDQVNFAKIFQQLGYDVAFAPMLEFNSEEQFKKPMASIGVRCVNSHEFVNIEEFVFLNADHIVAFFVSRFNFGGSWIEKARQFCPHAQVIFNTVDLHHVREERQALLIGDKQGLIDAEVTKKAEIERINAADISIVVSQAEKSILEVLTPAADVRVIPLIREIHDRDFPNFEARSDIAFVGGFQHQPNIDAVNYFLDEIWPSILIVDPSIKFYVIGSHISNIFSERTDLNVEWVGFVPELEPWLDKMKLTVAPLRFGAGAKGKVVSSLINGVPCIATQMAAEGMGIPEGHGIIAAGNSKDFAKQVLDLYQNKTKWGDVSSRGIAAVKQSYSLDHGRDLVEQILPRSNVT